MNHSQKGRMGRMNLKLGKTRYANGYFNEADWVEEKTWKFPTLPVILLILVFTLLAIAVWPR
jgi:hypothetical protein